MAPLNSAGGNGSGGKFPDSYAFLIIFVAHNCIQSVSYQVFMKLMWDKSVIVKGAIRREAW
jgi:hypothetical protein